MIEHQQSRADASAPTFAALVLLARGSAPRAQRERVLLSRKPTVLLVASAGLIETWKRLTW